MNAQPKRTLEDNLVAAQKFGARRKYFIKGKLKYSELSLILFKTSVTIYGFFFLCQNQTQKITSKPDLKIAKILGPLKPIFYFYINGTRHATRKNSVPGRVFFI